MAHVVMACIVTAVRVAVEAGIGATMRDFSLGGRTGPMHGDTLTGLTAYVRTISDGCFVMRAFSPGVATSVGPCVGLVIDGIDVIVASRRDQTFDTEIFKLHGITVEECDIVALKSSAHFRAGFRHIARLIVTSDAPGLSSLNPAGFRRTHAAALLWPMDEAAEYRAAAGAAGVMEASRL